MTRTGTNLKREVDAVRGLAALILFCLCLTADAQRGVGTRAIMQTAPTITLVFNLNK